MCIRGSLMQFGLTRGKTNRKEGVKDEMAETYAGRSSITTFIFYVNELRLYLVVDGKSLRTQVRDKMIKFVF